MKTIDTKIVKAVAATAIISLLITPLMAGGWEKNIDVGVSGNKLEYNSNQDYNWGVQLEMNSVKSFKSVAGFRLGWNLGFEYYTLGEVESLNDSAGYNVDAMILGGYAFNDKFDIPIELLAGLGYAGGQIGTDYNHGLSYKGVATLKITDGFGVGVQYKHVDLTVVTLGGEFDSGLDIASAFLSFSL